MVAASAVVGPMTSAEEFERIVRAQEHCVQTVLCQLEEQQQRFQTQRYKLHTFAGCDPSASVVFHTEQGPFVLVGYAIDTLTATSAALFLHRNQLVVMA